MKTLYLHVGGQKTGSTALQRYLELHTASLALEGLQYIPPNSIYPLLETSLLWQDLDLEKFGKDLYQKLYQSGAYNFLLSSELLCHLDFDQLSSITRHLEQVNIIWIFVHREPTQVLLSHWADRVTLFGDVEDLVDYVPMRIKSPFIKGRTPLYDVVQSGDLELQKIGYKFARLPGAKILLHYSPEIIREFLGLILPTYQMQGSENKRVHVSPGIATIYLTIEYLRLAMGTIGARFPYHALSKTSRVIREFLTPFDLSINTSQINIEESIYQDYPFLIPDFSKFIEEFHWNCLGTKHIYRHKHENSALDHHKLKEKFSEDVEELRRLIDKQALISLAMDTLRPFAFKK